MTDATWTSLQKAAEKLRYAAGCAGAWDGLGASAAADAVDKVRYPGTPDGVAVNALRDAAGCLTRLADELKPATGNGKPGDPVRGPAEVVLFLTTHRPTVTWDDGGVRLCAAGTSAYAPTLREACTALERRLATEARAQAHRGAVLEAVSKAAADGFRVEAGANEAGIRVQVSPRDPT